MTREQVIASLGYPISSENPDLDSDLWRYWLGSFEEFQLHFDARGRVKDITTGPATRNRVWVPRAAEAQRRRPRRATFGPGRSADSTRPQPTGCDGATRACADAQAPPGPGPPQPATDGAPGPRPRGPGK